MCRAVMPVLVFLTLFLGLESPAAAKRVALVIGNDAYNNLPKLQKAVNDARAVAQTLQDIGFEVVAGENLTRRETNRKLADLEASLAPGDQVFFFFAGHGVAIGAENYLIPTDMPKPRAGEDGLVQDEAHAINTLIERVQARGVASSLFVLDACRDNPFKATGVRSIGGTRGLTRVEAPSGVFVLFSAGIGQAALDRLSDTDPDPNSVFTRKLVPLLKTPGLSHVRLAKRVQREVATLAQKVAHKQQPAYYDQIIGEIVLRPGDIQKNPAGPEDDKLAALQKELEALRAEIRNNLQSEKEQSKPRRQPKKNETDIAVGVHPEKSTAPDRLDRAIEWKLAMAYPRAFPILGTSADRFATELQKQFNGTARVKIFGAAELVGAFDIFDAVAAGTVDMGWSTLNYWKSKEPALALFSHIPLGTDARAHARWRQQPRVRTTIDEIMATFGLIALPCAATTGEGDFWTNKSIRDSDDLKGLKIRFPGTQGDILASLGAVPLALPGSDVVPSLESSVIDAANWSIPGVDLHLGIADAARRYYYPGVMEPGHVIDLIVNKKLWDQSPPNLRAGIEQICRDNIDAVYAAAQQADKIALEKFRRAGIRVEPLSDEVRRALRQAWEAQARALSGQSSNFAELYRLAPR